MPTQLLSFCRSPYFLVAFAMFLSASNLIVGRAVAGEIPPVALCFWRWTIAFFFLLPFAWPALRMQYRTLLNAWKLLTLLGFFGITGFFVIVYAALQWTTAINASLINAAVPAVIPVIAWLMFSDRVTTRQALGIALTMIGVVIIVLRGDLRLLGEFDLSWGDPMILSATFFWAFYSVLLKRLPEGLNTTAVLTAVIGFGLVMLLPLYGLEMASGKTMPLDGFTIVTLLYVGIFCAAIGYLCWNYGVAKLGPNRTGVLFNLVPVFALFQAMLFLGENLYGYHYFGIPLVFYGIWLATAPPRVKA
ncbi:MAG: DMT family transporter [Alphaproteobacteria bacterium]|nr:DMT family transporter [Alphaproteobacteria bacterium]